MPIAPHIRNIKCEEGIQIYAKTILENNNIPNTINILTLKTLISSILFFENDITNRPIPRTYIPKNR